jgi:hypothetical protein
MQQDNNNSITVDTHYHANIYGLTAAARKQRKLKFIKWTNKNSVHIILSTEHTYKKPIDAYLHLMEWSSTTKTIIVPACEAISKEGIDIILVFKDESHLVNAGSVLIPFGWSITDLSSIKKATNCLIIIPHPYTLGTTGAGRILERSAYQQLLKIADYIEIESGAYFAAFNLVTKITSKSWVEKKLPWLMQAYNTPETDFLLHIGYAIGSDAHAPEHQYRVGIVDFSLQIALADIFGFLAKKHHFRGIDCNKQPLFSMIPSIPKNLFYSLQEAQIKRKTCQKCTKI